MYNSLWNSLLRNFISEISSDRTELRLDTTDILDFEVVTTTTAFIQEIQSSPLQYIDFCLNLIRNNKEVLIAKDVKFSHYGSKSIDKKYKNVVMLTRAWHFNWSKFYFYKKNYNYIYALTRIIPNFYQAIRNFFINLIKLNLFGAKLNLVEMYGILSSIFLLKSFYRAK